jgi:Fe-S-cluster-containing dehydrogenase component
MRNGLLIDTEYCSGCYSCEVACRNELKLPLDQWGIVLNQVGPFHVDAESDKFIWNYTPMVTDLCDLCEARVATGEKPACVLNCLANAITYGPLDELVKMMDEKGKKAYIMIP